MTKKIALIVMATLAMMTFHAQAEETSATQTGPNFEQNKAEMLKNIDERLSAVQDLRACISSAASREALKECHQKHRMAMKEMRLENMEDRHEKKMERMKNRMNNKKEK